MFTGWIYDYLRPHAAAIRMAHPLMLRAIAVAKKKNDRMDGRRSIGEIALAIGFQSSSAFSTAFTRVVGCSPTRFALIAHGGFR